MPEQKLLSHGFSSWIAFLQATLSLGVTVGSVVIVGVLYFLDGRYASAGIAEQVTTNAKVALATKTALMSVEKRLIARDYRDTWTEYCNVSSQEAKSSLRHRLQDLEDDWKAATKDPLPTLLPCAELH